MKSILQRLENLTCPQSALLLFDFFVVFTQYRYLFLELFSVQYPEDDQGKTAQEIETILARQRKSAVSFETHGMPIHLAPIQQLFAEDSFVAFPFWTVSSPYLALGSRCFIFFGFPKFLVLRP